MSEPASTVCIPSSTHFTCTVDSALSFLDGNICGVQLTEPSIMMMIIIMLILGKTLPNVSVRNLACLMLKESHAKNANIRQNIV